MEGIYSSEDRNRDRERIKQFFEINPKKLKFADGMHLIHAFVTDKNSIYQYQKFQRTNKIGRIQ